MIQAPGVVRVAIGNPAVADVKALPEAKQVIVTGLTDGTTDLIIWSEGNKKETYSIQVKSGVRNLEPEVGALLKGIEGIRLRVNGGRLIIDGQVFRGEDLDRIHKVLQMYPAVVNLTRVNQNALKYLGQEADSALDAAGFEHVKIRAAGDTLYLEGEVSKKSDAERAERVVSSIYSRVSNQLTVGVNSVPLVLIDLKMMEVRSNSLGEVGVRWPDQINLKGSGSIGTGSMSSTTLGFQAEGSLRMLMEKGYARMLANPKLLCRSGTPASFMAGGEIPIRLVSERTANIIFKQYGVSLNVTAQADQSRKVSLDIEAKVSDLDSATAIDNIPGIVENNVKTAANLRLGDTIVLGGLIGNRARKNIKKVPLLGHIPILGELFKSRSFQKNETEFLVFLTPLPADPGSFTHEKQLRHMDEGMQKKNKELELSILD